MEVYEQQLKYHRNNKNVPITWDRIQEVGKLSSMRHRYSYVVYNSTIYLIGGVDTQGRF